MTRKAATLACLACLALPASALGAGVTTPPGNSEADQYGEALPGPSGNHTANGTRSPEDAVKSGQLSASDLQALEAKGPQGEAVARLAAQTGPDKGPKSGGSGSNGGGAGSASATNAPSEESLGTFFWLILIGTAVVATAYWLRRRQTRAGT